MLSEVINCTRHYHLVSLINLETLNCLGLVYFVSLVTNSIKLAYLVPTETEPHDFHWVSLMTNLVFVVPHVEMVTTIIPSYVKGMD